MIKTLKRLYALLDLRERKLFVLLIFVMLMEAFFEMIGVGMIPVFVTIVAFPEKIREYPFFEFVENIVTTSWLEGEKLIYLGSVTVLVFFIGKSFFAVLSTYFKLRYAQNLSLRLSKRLFGGYLEAPYVFYFNRGSADLILNVTNECILLSNKVLMQVIDLMSQTMILVGIIIILMLNVPLDLLCALVLFLSCGVGGVTFLTKYARSLGEEAHLNRKLVLRSVKEGFAGVKEIKLLQRIPYFEKQFGGIFFRLLQIERIVRVIQEALPGLIELVTVIGLLGVTVYLFSDGEGPEKVIPVLSIFAVALVRLKGSMRVLMFAATEIRHNEISLETIHRELGNIEALGSSRRGLRKSLNNEHSFVFENRLEIRDVWYKYPEGTESALKGISLDIRRGEVIGFVGASGAGKSTLIDVIIGVLEPDKGLVSVDGHDIHDDLYAWQKKIGYIPQSIFFVDGSIKHNIGLAIEDTEIDEKALRRAINVANLAVMIDALPEGVDTVIGEKGVRLSGGEKQRVGIARALYNNPDVLVLDEATSALDNVTEAAVVQEVEALKGERTILVIAHRLSTVRRCDRIAFLKDGRIDAIGSYQALADQHPDFIKMLTASEKS